jgi:hypothetical protein
MKHRTVKINKKRAMRVFAVILILLLGALAVVYYFGSQEEEPVAEEETSEIQEEEEVIFTATISHTVADSDDADDAVLDCIVSYLDTYYQALAELDAEQADFSALFDSTDSDALISEAMNESALQYLIAYRAAWSQDLRCGVLTYELSIDDVDTSGSSVTVEVTVDETEQFEYLSGEESNIYGTYHEFVLTKSGDQYLIQSHEAEETAYLVIESAVEDESSGTVETIESATATAITRAETAIQSYMTLRDEYNADPTSYAFAKTYDNAYDGDAAVAYALQWVTKRNTAEWSAYDAYGGNCANFVSQCVYAGGIPMDTTGDDVWKWYGESPNNTTSKTGRSASWTGVNSFYNYCTDNTGSGMVADTGGNLYAGTAETW